MLGAVLLMAADRVGGAGVASRTTVTAPSVRRPLIRLTEAVDPTPVAVDEVVVTTLVDSVSDGLLTGDDRVTRAPFGSGLVAAPQFEGGRTHAGLRAAHGLSARVSVRRWPTITTLLFHAGVSPDGMTTDAERLRVDLGTCRGSSSVMGTSTTSAGSSGSPPEAGCR